MFVVSKVVYNIVIVKDEYITAQILIANWLMSLNLTRVKVIF